MVHAFLMLYNKRMIFLYKSFFVNYILLFSFGWALNYSALSSGAQSLGTVYTRARRIWQSPLS